MAPATAQPDGQDRMTDSAARWMFVSYAHKQGFGWVSINHRTISDGHDLKALNDAIAEETGHEGVCVLTWKGLRWHLILPRCRVTTALC